MVMSDEEAETKEQSSLNFQRDMLLKARAIEGKVYVHRRANQETIIYPRVVRINTHTYKYRLIINKNNKSYKMG